MSLNKFTTLSIKEWMNIGCNDVTCNNMVCETLEVKNPTPTPPSADKKAVRSSDPASNANGPAENIPAFPASVNVSQTLPFTEENYNVEYFSLNFAGFNILQEGLYEINLCVKVAVVSGSADAIRMMMPVGKVGRIQLSTMGTTNLALTSSSHELNASATVYMDVGGIVSIRLSAVSPSVDFNVVTNFVSISARHIE